MGIKKIMTPEQKKVARYAKALGHPIRIYILKLL
jgi:ArsR family transcriptional regulator, arsenate/arsenite/antimonite-responsive transcriptional repressor